jgi:heme oxygenase
VYEALEEAVAADERYAPFRATGLERAAPLRADIAWFAAEYGLAPPPLAPDGPGATYAALVKELARADPPAFICHFYNTYFAHTAGGRMIGAKLSQALLGGRTLAFHSYDGDFRPLLDAVRAKIDDMAGAWSRPDKDRCLDETAASFRRSGALLRTIAEPTKKEA